MLTPDEIKKLIEIAKPEEFNCYEDIDGLTLVIGIKHETLFIDNNMVLEEVFYPLFLQRCIEGINRKSLNGNTWTYIETTINQIVVFDGEESYKPFEDNSIDQAKEEALRYILEQMEG